MEQEVVGEGLEPGGLAHREVADRAVGTAQHVLAAGHAMDAGLQGLGRGIQRAAGMTGIGTSAGDESVVGDTLGSPWVCLLYTSDAADE